MATATTRAKDPKIIGESQKIFGILKKVFLGLAILLLIISIVGWGRKKAREAEEAAQKQAATQPAPLQHWQLCWERGPGAEGIPSQCLPAKISRTPYSLALVYPYNDKQGMMEGSSRDGMIYDGLWRDPGGWGNFQLRFTSPTSAVGWVDEKGSKPANFWLIAK